MTTHARTPTVPTVQELAALAASSFDTIVALQDASGAYPASPTFSAYRGYCWFRDGAFIADGVSSLGGVDSASAFFDWCARILLTREEQVQAIVLAAAVGNPVPDSEMLPTRFTFAGIEGDDDWWDFQLDGYGTWLWAVVEHARRHGLALERWQRAIQLSVDYLVSSWSRPCFDWWEESSDRVHVSTLGCIAAGLSAVLEAGVLDAARQRSARSALEAILATVHSDGKHDGHLGKWLGSGEVDASLLAVIAPLGVIPADEPLGLGTIRAVDDQLNVDGGVHRYLADTFFGGGQWPLLSCFLGLALLAAGDREAALGQLRWAASTATEHGDLPEQSARHLLDPSMIQEWLDRWGPVATPLLWSHAMYIRLAVELGVARPRTESAP